MSLVGRNLTLEPCGICGEPSAQHGVEITPAVERTRSVPGSDGKPLVAKVIVRAAVKVDLCAVHYRHHVDQKGWQQREEEKRKINTAEAKKRLKRDQISLLDNPTHPFEDAA